MVFSMICHCVGCLWIFTAELSIDEEDTDQINWIYATELENGDITTKYTTAVYWTVTTISTVGYGDISGNNNLEKCMCIILMITGVFFFSFTAGSLTSII